VKGSPLNAARRSSAEAVR